MKFKVVLVTLLFSLMNFNLAQAVSIHFSENSTCEIPDGATTKICTYTTKDSMRNLNPQNKQDADKLAISTEFEVYTVNELTQTHTIYNANAGICYSYHHNGVEITDSSTHYLDADSKEQYYANISGGIVSAKGNTKNVQYAVIYNISDSGTSQRIQEQNTQSGRYNAEHTLQERSRLLSNTVCP